MEENCRKKTIKNRNQQIQKKMHEENYAKRLEKVCEIKPIK